MKCAIDSLEGERGARGLLVCTALPGRGRVKVKCQHRLATYLNCRFLAFLGSGFWRRHESASTLGFCFVLVPPEQPFSCLYWLGDSGKDCGGAMASLMGCSGTGET